MFHLKLVKRVKSSKLAKQERLKWVIQDESRPKSIFAYNLINSFIQSFSLLCNKVVFLIIINALIIYYYVFLIDKEVFATQPAPPHPVLNRPIESDLLIYLTC